MNSPLFNALGGASNMGGMLGMIQQFQQFRQNFKGDPRQQVQQMLNSGRISQAQYNQAVQMAQQLQRALNGQ